MSVTSRSCKSAWVESLIKGTSHDLIFQILLFHTCCFCLLFVQFRDPSCVLNLKVPATIPYFNFHFFPHLLIFLQFRDPLLCTKLIHQSSPAEMTYVVQESQIFAVWINFSPGINYFRRVFLEINHLNLDFQISVVNLTIFSGCIMCIYYIFQFSEIIFFSFKCTTHNKTKILGN